MSFCALRRLFNRRTARTLQPLTYLSQAAVLLFMPIGPRKKLAKKCPGIRKLHRKLPFDLKIVKIQLTCWPFHEIVFDDLEWDPKLLPKRSEKVRVNDKKRLEINIEKQESMMGRFFSYYLDRKGARVEECVLEGAAWVLRILPFVKIGIFRVGNCITDIGSPDFLTNYHGYHFEEIQTPCSLGSWKMLEHMGELCITTDYLVVMFDIFRDKYHDVQRHNIAKRICFVEKNKNWLSYGDLLRSDSEAKFKCGTVFKGLNSYNPWSNTDWMDSCRKQLEGEFKYYDGRIGACIDVPANRELFLYQQLITDKNRHLFTDYLISDENTCYTAMVLEKGTTKHYHQLPLDLQNKFRDSEEDRNRIRIIPNYYQGYEELPKQRSLWKRIGFWILVKIW